MTASDWRKVMKQLKAKPAVMEKFLKHNKPKERKIGISVKKCETVKGLEHTLIHMD